MCRLKFSVTNAGHREEIRKKRQNSLESQLPPENPRIEKNSLKLQNLSLMSVFLSHQSPKITYFQSEIQSRYSPACQDTFQTTSLSVCRSASILRRKDDSDLQILLTSIQQTRKAKPVTYSTALNSIFFSWNIPL